MTLAPICVDWHTIYYLLTTYSYIYFYICSLNHQKFRTCIMWWALYTQRRSSKIEHLQAYRAYSHKLINKNHAETRHYTVVRLPFIYSVNIVWRAFSWLRVRSYISNPYLSLKAAQRWDCLACWRSNTDRVAPPKNISTTMRRPSSAKRFSMEGATEQPIVSPPSSIVEITVSQVLDKTRCSKY